jgi:hypothetical protein
MIVFGLENMVRFLSETFLCMAMSVIPREEDVQIAGKGIDPLSY